MALNPNWGVWCCKGRYDNIHGFLMSQVTPRTILGVLMAAVPASYHRGKADEGFWNGTGNDGNGGISKQGRGNQVNKERGD